VHRVVGSWSGRQWARFFLIAGIIALIAIVVILAGDVLIPFLVGVLVGYIVLPLVDWLQRHIRAVVHSQAVARALAILLVYLAGLALIAGLFLYLIPVVVAQVRELVASGDLIIAEIQAQLAGLQEYIVANVPEQVRTFVVNQIRTLGDRIVMAITSGLVNALTGVGATIASIVGYLIIPFWLVYFLYGADDLGHAFLSLFPEQVRPDLVNVDRIFDDVIGAYVRGQLLVALIDGILVGLILSLIGVEFPVLLGLIAAIGDLIPTLGPILAAIPALIIAALEEPILALWTLLALLGIEQFENIVLGPRIVGEAVRLNPVVIIVLLVVAGDIAGFFGLLVVVPLAAFLRDLVRYVNYRTSPAAVLPAEALRRVRRARHKHLRRPAGT
jgi:predicted PurR-regulated permease PerM